MIPLPVVEESELLSLVVMWGVLFIMVISRRSLAPAIPAFNIFFLSFLFSLFAAIFTNLEAFYLPEPLNLIEHICYAASMFLFVVWLTVFFKSRRGTR